MRPGPLPHQLPDHFTTEEAMRLGVTRSRLRASDLSRPFHGVRQRRNDEPQHTDKFAAARACELRQVAALATRLTAGQFLSHRSAAVWWGAPLPIQAKPTLHASTIRPQRSPRIAQVTGHSFVSWRVKVVTHQGSAVSSPAFTFASMGTLDLPRLVALGDFFVRTHRQGVGRPSNPGPPLCSRADLYEALEIGGWHNSTRLSRALELVREDSWSPRESMTRVMLVQGGIPEPDLNTDVRDSQGNFLGCLDMVFAQYKVALEYQGEVHALTFANDIERIERLRAEGWVILQVTKALDHQPELLLSRVAQALQSRGWPSRSHTRRSRAKLPLAPGSRGHPAEDTSPN